MSSKGQAKPVIQKETWAGAFKAIAIRALSYGKFWQVCYATVIGLFVWKLEPNEPTKILQLLLSSNLFAVGGWVCFTLTVVGGIFSIRFMRARYLEEIERLCKERDQLQEKLLERALRHSNSEPKKLL